MEAQHLLQPISEREREGQSGHLYYWQRVRWQFNNGWQYSRVLHVALSKPSSDWLNQKRTSGQGERRRQTGKKQRWQCRLREGLSKRLCSKLITFKLSGESGSCRSGSVGIGRWTGGKEPGQVAESRRARAVTADNGSKQQQPVVLLSLCCFFSLSLSLFTSWEPKLTWDISRNYRHSCRPNRSKTQMKLYSLSHNLVSYYPKFELTLDGFKLRALLAVQTPIIKGQLAWKSHPDIQRILRPNIPRDSFGCLRWKSGWN